MNTEKRNINEISKIVADEFTISGFEAPLKKHDFKDLEEYKIFLTRRLTEMIEKNFDLLIKTLYRIDISEQKLSELFSGKNREFIPEKLADMIIERQLMKLELRRRYKRGEL